MSLVFKVDRIEEACELIINSQAHFSVTYEGKEKWPTAFMPDLLTWGYDILLDNLQALVNINCSRYGLDDKAIRITVAPCKWFVECEITEDRTYFNSVTELYEFLRAQCWRDAKSKNLVGWEPTVHEKSLDELVEEL